MCKTTDNYPVIIQYVYNTCTLYTCTLCVTLTQNGGHLLAHIVRHLELALDATLARDCLTARLNEVGEGSKETLM